MAVERVALTSCKAKFYKAEKLFPMPLAKYFFDYFQAIRCNLTTKLSLAGT